MARNKKIMLDVGLNLQEAIKDYEKLIQEFRNKGASPKAMFDITKQFAQIQQAASRLQAQLRQGFTNSKGLLSFQDSLSKLQGDFINLDGSLKNILANYQDFSNTVSKETQAMSKNIKNGINEQNKALNELRRNMAKGAGLKNKDALSGIVSDETFNTAIANFRERLRASIAEINNQINQEILESRVKSGVQAVGTAVKNTAEYKDKDVEGLKQGIQQTVAKAFEKGSEEGLKAAAEEIQKQVGAKEFSTASIQNILQAAYEDKGIQANSKLIGKRDNAERTLSGLEGIETRLINSDEYKNRLIEIQRLLQQSTAAEIQAAQAKEQDATAQARLNTQIDQARPKFDNNINDLLRSANAATEVARKSESLAKEFKNLFSRFTYMFSITSIFNTFRTQLRNTLNDIRNLDRAYSSIAYVSNETVSSLWKTYDQYSNMAEKLGQSTADVIKASAIYRQQGLDTTQALELTTDTMKLATIAGNDYSKATQEMTAALRGFKMEMDEGAHVSDVYSELAAHAAASVDGIAQAMSRTASIANSAGMSFENTSAFLTQMIETTQESAENIGTSLKTIVARFTELKQNVDGTSESEFSDLEFNKVDKALKSVGVDLKDVNGQFRNLDDVFLELSSKWDGLSRNAQRYVATIAAGSRQQSRFIALMDNYERTSELIKIAEDSAGKTEEQFAKAADTVEFKINALKTAWEEFRLALVNQKWYKGIIDGITEIVNSIKNMASNGIWSAVGIAVGVLFAKSAFAGFRDQLSNFGPSIKNTIAAYADMKIQINEASRKQAQQKLDDLANRASELQAQLNSLAINIRNDRAGLSNLPILDALENNAKARQSKGANKYKKDLKKLTREIATESGKSVQEVEKVFKELELKGGESVNKVLNKINEMRSKIQVENPTSITQEETAEIVQSTAALKDKNAAEAQLIETQQQLNQAEEQSARTQTYLQAITRQTTSSIEKWINLKNFIQTIEPSLKMAAGQVGMFATSLLMGADATTVFKTSLFTLVPQLITTIAQSGLAALQAKAYKEQLIALAGQEKADAILKNYRTVATLKEAFANGTLEISEETLTVATNKLAAAEAMRNALMGAGVMAVLAITAAVFAYVKALNKAHKSGLELAEANREIAESQSLIAKSNRKEMEETVNESGKLLEKYQELNKVQNKNTEQQEEFDSILSEIKEKYPEFITYYGTMNDQVAIQVEKWKEILETQKEILKVNQAIEKASEGATEKAKREEKIAQLNKRRQDLSSDFGSYDWSNTMVDALRSKYNIPKGIKVYDWLSISIKQIDDQIALLEKDTANEISKFAEANSIKTGTHYLRSLAAVSVNQQKQLSRQDEIQKTFKDLYDNLDYEEQQSIKEFLKDGEEYIVDVNTGEIKDGFFKVEKRAETTRKLNNIIAIMQGIQGFADSDYFSRLSNEELDRIVSGDISGERLDKIYQNALTDAETNALNIYKNSYDKIASEVKNRLGQVDFKLSTNELTTLNNQLKDIQDKIGEQAAKILIKSFKGMPIEDVQKFISKNHLDDINLLNLSNIISALEASDSMAASKLYNATNFTGADVLYAADQQGQLLDKLISQENVFQSISQGKATSNTVKKMLKEFGLENDINITEYYTGNKLTKGGALLADLKEKLASSSQADLIKAYNAIREGTEEDKGAYEELKLQNQELLAFIENTLSARTAIDDLFDEIKKKGKTVSDTISSFYSSGFVSTDMIAQLKETFKNNDFDINYFVNDNLTLNTERLLKYYKETEIARLNAEIEILKEQNKDITEIVLKRDALLREIDEAQKKAIEDRIKKQKEYTDKLRDQEKALKDIADKQKDLNKAYEDYNKLLYGSDFFKSSLGNLYNYEVLLSKINDEISRTKELFEDSNTYQDAMDTLDKYLNLLHKRQAYNEAMLAQYRAGMTQARYELENSAFISYEGVFANYSDYIRFDERTGEALIDKELLEQARINDEVKKNIEELVKTYNENASKVRQIEDELIKAQKELLEMRKQATATMADFESSIADRLKEQYQKEVDTLRNKYDSMKQADDDYVSALQEALEKQRKLREQEKEWQNLSTKEKKLSLMSRDTSGANEIERQKLEKEIEESRQQLLDNTIDRAVESMEKLYESQDELRQTEIEVKEALIEDSSYWNMAAHNVAENLTSFDDYYDQVLSKDEDYLNMTQVQREKFLNEETDNYNNAMQAAAILTIDNIENIEQILAISGEEIENTIVEVSDVFSLNVSKTIQEVQTALDTQIEDAKTKISNAITALDEANTKYAEICKQVKDLYDQIVGIAGENGNLHDWRSPDYDRNAYTISDDSYASMPSAAQSEYNNARHPYSDKGELTATPEESGSGQFLTEEEAYGLIARQVGGATQKEIEKVIDDCRTAVRSGRKEVYGTEASKTQAILSALQYMISQPNGIGGYSVGAYCRELNISTQVANGIKDLQYVPIQELGWNYHKYKSGGLVNYTGPAWVDGTPQQPEAFLSPEDTERIGNAAKLLANLPLLNPTANISSTNTSYGDTKVEITLNIDKLSSDVDIDNMIERVKNSIVEVARPVGSNVILQQQI